jgi:aminomethyltransferase
LEQFKVKKMKTPLYDRHVALGAKIVDFQGWEMPVQYQGIIQEHLNVRQNVGLFDVSHMGRILVEGPEAEKFLDYLSTNKISGKADLTATYTVWSLPKGGCVDDVIVYKVNSDHFFVIVNAGNRQKDLEHILTESRKFDVVIQDRYTQDGILAIQGPKAQILMSHLFSEANSLKHMHFCFVNYSGQSIVLSRTGYTGAGGFEIYGPNSVIVELWDRILQEGKPYGILPIGLGARDTLRLEMGYALYGHEIDEVISANESVSAWTVKWDKPQFLGKEALMRIEQDPNKRSEYGIILIDKGIARAGYEVLLNDQKIGIVTSGTHSPSLNQAIAIILVKRTLQPNDLVEVQIRQNRCKAKVVKLPFVKGTT